MTDSISMPLAGKITGAVRPPGSKSISNRALLCAAVAAGTSRLQGLLQSDDTQVMVAALQQLGVDLAVDWPAATATIRGRAGRLAGTDCTIFVGNSGTTARFLVPVLAACGTGRYLIDGTPRMRQRPMGDLVQALRDWGVGVTAAAGGGLPLQVEAAQPRGGRLTVAADLSSQFLSGLLLASPFAAAATEWSVRDKMVSAPFVEMTQQIMGRFGVACHADGPALTVQPGGYRACDFAIEPDATAASYFWAAAAVTGGEVCVEGLGHASCQGDLRFVELLRQMGCTVTREAERTTVRGGPLRGIDCEMGDISDTVPTLAVVALFATGETVIRGVAHNRLKESNRIDDLAAELQRIGGDVTATPDGLRIRPAPLRPGLLGTHDDHRLAMSFAVIGLRVAGIRIQDPGCVAKTYPGYFADLGRLLAGESA